MVAGRSAAANMQAPTQRCTGGRRACSWQHSRRSGLRTLGHGPRGPAGHGTPAAPEPQHPTHPHTREQRGPAAQQQQVGGVGLAVGVQRDQSQHGQQQQAQLQPPVGQQEALGRGRGHHGCRHNRGQQQLHGDDAVDLQPGGGSRGKRTVRERQQRGGPVINPESPGGDQPSAGGQAGTCAGTPADVALLAVPSRRWSLPEAHLAHKAPAQRIVHAIDSRVQRQARLHIAAASAAPELQQTGRQRQPY